MFTKPSKSAIRFATEAPAPSVVEQRGAPLCSTPGDLADVLGVEFKPPLTPAQIKHLRRALPGYAASLDDVADLLARDGAVLGMGDVDPAELVDLQRRHRQLRAAEIVLEALHQSVYHQRLQLDDRAMGLLQRIARRVQSRAEEDPQLPLRWGVLLGFLGAFRRGRGRGPTAARPSGPEEGEG